MKILTFDIEEWFIEQNFNGDRSEKYLEFDKYLNSILDLLDETKTIATFFCLGKVATNFPNIIKTIAGRGHEIGCHSNSHLWLTQMSPRQLKEDTHDALAALQDVIGQPVNSYRAPAFSIGVDNKWAIEVLASEGIQYDASIFPARRDFGGFDGFPTDSPTIISYNGTNLKEFPICLTPILGHDIAYSGGGYFRLFPYSFIKNKIQQSEYAMTYFHIGDLINQSDKFMSRNEYETYFRETGNLRNRVMRYIKSNLGTKTAFPKLCKLVRNIQFVSLSQASHMINWDSVNKIEL